MKYLITGGAGFVGSNLAESLLKDGHEVIVIDNLSRAGSKYGLKRLIKHSKFTFHKRNICFAGPIIKSTKNLDAIYHLAAQVAVTTSYDNPTKDFRINACGTATVVNNAGNIPVIYASTNKVFGDNVNLVPIKELKTRYDFDGELQGKGISDKFSIDAQHHTPYGCSKLAGDICVRDRGGIVNRFSCMYGINQFGNSDQGWVSHFIISEILKKPIEIFGDGKQVRDLLYIDDVVRLLRKEADMADGIRGEAFTIGGGYNKTTSLLELCDILNTDNLTFKEWRPADQKVYYSDISKAMMVLGWGPKVNVETGVKLLYAWAKENKDLLIKIAEEEGKAKKTTNENIGRPSCV